MRFALKSFFLAAACIAGLSACGDSGQSGNNVAAGNMTQARQAVISQKTAASNYNEVVEQLYVAYFGRPADPNGLTNFSNRLAQAGAPSDIQGLIAAYNTNATVKSLIDSFGTSTESEALYGTASTTEFITDIYVNVLGRQPDPSGETFWIDAINNGQLTYGAAALNIMAAALADATNTAQGAADAALVADRITVATDFTAAVAADNATADYSGSTAAATARSMLSGITTSTSSSTYETTVNQAVQTIIADTPVNNTVAITVDGGNIPGTDYVDAAFVTVTICAPSNPSLCQSIDHVLVDTGSYGLRLIYSTLNSQMAAALTAQSSSSTMVECTTFLDGYSWGPVRQVNFSIAGESASNMNMQVIGDPNFNNDVPHECSAGLTAEDTVASFGSNGVIGVGLFSNDCGACATTHEGMYFTCTQNGCQDSLASVAQQVSNPVSQFATDNNGVIIELPAVPISAAGESTVSGTMIFGVNTQSNNSLGSATVFQMDESGYFTTIFNGSSLNQSFVDSGSNGLYFPNLTNIATCSDDFYCPSSTLSLTATMQGQANTVTNAVATEQIPFSIGYADSVTGAASVDYGAPMPGSSFDWGLPFFFGRNVYVVMDGTTASGQDGPFVAF